LLGIYQLSKQIVPCRDAAAAIGFSLQAGNPDFYVEYIRNGFIFHWQEAFCRVVGGGV
jgi:hypothetical protein